MGISVGTTLTWENLGSVIHTATDNQGTWDTGDIPSGQSRSVTFNTAGTYNLPRFLPCRMLRAHHDRPALAIRPS